MDTGSGRIDINEGSSGVTANTSSSIYGATGAISSNDNVNTSSYQTNNTGNTYEIEEVDLSLNEPEEEGFFESLGKGIDSGLSAIGNWFSGAAADVGDFFCDVGEAIYDTGAKVVNDVKTWASDRIEDLKGIGRSLAETASNVASNVSSLLGSFGNWVTQTALPTVGNALKRTGASIGNVVTGLVQGVGQFGEALVDTVAIVGTGVASIVTGLADGFQWIGGKITGNENWHSITKEMWGGTMDFVKTEYVNGWFDKFHKDTALGKWLDDNAYAPFKSDGVGYKIANGVGYIAGIIALTIATMGIGTAVTGGAAAAGASTSIATVHLGSVATIEITKQAVVSACIATAAGFGKNTSAAWNDGASLMEGMGYGLAKGTWEGLEMFIGAEINTLKFASLGIGAFGQQAVTTGAHVALDTIDGASASFIDPLMQMIYNPNETNMEQIMYMVNYDKDGNQISNKTWDDLSFSEKYDALFQYNGGWAGVMTAAGSAGAISFLTEIPDLAKALRGTKTLEEIAAATAATTVAGSSGKEAAEAGASSIQTPKSDLQLYLEKYMLDPDATPPMGISKEVIDFLETYKNNPDATLPLGMPKEIVDFVNGKQLTGDAVSAAAGTGKSTITPPVPSKKIVDMTEEEIHAAIKDEIAALDPNAADYAQKLALLQEKEALEVELAKRMAGVSAGDASKSIDMLDETRQAQVRQAAQEVYDRALQQEAAVTASMKNLTDPDTTLEGLDFRTKSLGSIEDKLARKLYDGLSIDQAQGSINDSLRYTLIVNGDYESTVLAKLKMLQQDGFDVVDLNNAWGKPTYQGLNVTLRNQDGLLVELQFHTPSSFNTKQVVNHELYELSRNTSTSKEIRNISDRIQALNQRIYVGGETSFNYYDAYSLRQAVDSFSLFKNYKHANGYQDFLTENQQNLDTWDRAVKDDPTLGQRMWAYKGETDTDPSCYKVVNAHLRGNLFDDQARIITITGTGGFPMKYTYEQFEQMVGCTIDEYKLRVETAARELSNGIQQCHLATNTELTRGVNWDTLDFLFGIKENDPIDVINAKLAAAGVWTEPGFMSACPNVNAADLPGICAGKPVRLIMECDTEMGARVFPMDWEKEVLLDKGQSFTIKSAEYGSDGKLYIYMTHKK